MAYKPASFLDKYDTILFDMDGVITSEEGYWEAAALAIHEFLNSNKYYGSKDYDPSFAFSKKAELRTKYFCDDKTIKYVKKLGFNTNWDLAYIVLAIAIHLEAEDDFEPVYEYLKELNMNADELCEHIETILADDLCMPREHMKRFGDFWTEIQLSFQEWFLGNKLFEHNWHVREIQPGKQGIVKTELPVCDKDKIVKVLETLSKTHTLGIGTGRPAPEALGALDAWDIRKYFDETRIINHDYLKRAESHLADEGKDVVLSKPHPFIFLKGVFGDEICDCDIAHKKYDKEKCKKTLVIGDAMSDLKAALAGDCDFAAVLTGIDGKDARKAFEEANATYILDNVLCLCE